MIGGCDITLHSSCLIEDLIHRAADAILSIWLKGVIEAADTENKLLQLQELFGGVYKEVFVYKDRESHASWTSNGWTRKNCKSMIHLLAYPDTGTLTCVLENPDVAELHLTTKLSMSQVVPRSLVAETQMQTSHPTKAVGSGVHGKVPRTSGPI
jgi:hypothetical protein